MDTLSPQDIKRIKMRERARLNGKRHPNIMEDGRLWREAHPFGQFSSLEEKRKHHREKYYKHVPRVRCEICGFEYFETQKEKHERSQNHQKVINAIKNLLNKPEVLEKLH